MIERIYYFREGGGVTFIDPENEENNRHTFRDFDLILKNENVTNPEPHVNFLEIPFRDGSLDLSEPLGDGSISFKDRYIDLDLSDNEYRKNGLTRFSELAQLILGRKMKIVLDKDPSFYYIGRCVGFSDPEVTANTVTETVSFEVEPFRYANCSVQDPWMWDPFNFEDDLAIDSGTYTVDGTLTLYVRTGEIDETPLITVDSQMTLEFEGKTYTLRPETTKKNYDIRLMKRKENVLVFKGHGTMTIDYRGGRF